MNLRVYNALRKVSSELNDEDYKFADSMMHAMRTHNKNLSKEDMELVRQSLARQGSGLDLSLLLGPRLLTIPGEVPLAALVAALTPKWSKDDLKRYAEDDKHRAKVYWIPGYNSYTTLKAEAARRRLAENK